MLILIPYISCVYGQGLTSLGHNQYTRILFVQASVYPSYGTKFREDCKTTKPSLDIGIFLSKEPQGMEVLPLIEHILWVYVQGISSMKHNQYTGIPFTHVTE